MNEKVRLVALDFSGTLSLGAARFSRPKKLARALRDSGLSSIGVDGQNFWAEIICPGWQQGSTTGAGYLQQLIAGACRIAAAGGTVPDPELVCVAASRFTKAYLRCSTIGPQWVPILCRLARCDQIVIATDHYAEATAQIIDECAKLGLAAAPALKARPGQIVVANSADFGACKEDPVFWAGLKKSIPAVFTNVLLVDDFGFNEQRADSYGAAKKVAGRSKATVEAIQAAWNVPVDVFPFLLRRGQNYSALVAAAGRFLLEG